MSKAVAKVSSAASLDAQPAAAPVVVSEAAAIFSMIERVASQPDVPVERVEQLFRLYTQMDAERARRAYNAAFAVMQPALPAVARKGTAHNAKKYARYEDISAAVLPILAVNGFGLSFRITEQPGKVVVRAVLSHKDGHSEHTEFAYPFDTSGNKNAIQAIGSATQYGKRYTASALLGIATKDEDDDGKAAGGGEVINADQFDELAKLIRDTDTDLSRFLALGNLESLSDMPRHAFDKAKGLLLAKKRQQAGGQ